MARKPNSPEREAWCNIHKRCNNPRHKSYKEYGGRGVKRCAGYDTFEAFYADVGEKPEPKSAYKIDKIDNFGHYSCGKCAECLANGWGFNVRWILTAGSNRNRRCVTMITVGDRTEPINVFCQENEITHRDAWKWFDELGDWGLAIQAAVASKTPDPQAFFINDEWKTYMQIEAETGLSRYTFKHRITKQGMTHQEAYALPAYQKLPRNEKLYAAHGLTLNKKGWAKRLGISLKTLEGRFFAHKHLPLEVLLSDWSARPDPRLRFPPPWTPSLPPLKE